MKKLENKVLGGSLILRKKLNPFQGDLKKENPNLIAKLERNIIKNGFRAPLFIWHDNNNFILDGHQRLKALNSLYKQGYELEEDKVPICYIVAKTQKEAREIVMEQHAKYSEFNLDVVPRFISGLELEDIPVVKLNELETQLEEDNVDFTDDTQENIEEPENIVVKKGDKFKLGKHYLLCGDSTKKEDVEKLMQEHIAEMVFTDPPYNVKISGIQGLGKIKHDEFMMASGEMSEDEFINFLSNAFKNLVDFTSSGSIHYICMDWKHIFEIMKAIKQNYTEFKNLCVWNKDNGGMGTFYRSKHELIFVCKNGEDKHINNFELGQNGRYRTNVWDYKGVNSFGSSREDLKLHPTVKPTELVCDAILDCSNEHGTILDLFGGSGTTLIASEKTNRRCFMMELDPKYCQIIIKRFYNATSGTQEIKCLNRNLDLEEIIN